MTDHLTSSLTSNTAGTISTRYPKPFVKWAGGKRQLLSVLSGNMPDSFGSYYEPFLGGGAMFFHIASAVVSGYGSKDDGLDVWCSDNDLCAPSRHDVSTIRARKHKHKHKYHISDLNSDLVLGYRVIRDHPDELVKSLKRHEKKYTDDPESYYYLVRDTYDADKTDEIDTVSRLVFLNRTCFNGLYRVNKSGKFNVPIGRYKNPNIADAANIHAVSELLNSVDVDISCRDFGDLAQRAEKNDFVYFDPPYLPVSKTASFTQYTGCDFGLDDQRRLADLCITLDKMGCKVMLSNSDSGVISEMFARDEWTVERVSASRMINSNSTKRTNHTEMIVKNY